MKLQIETNTGEAEINHGRTCPSTQKEADNEKKTWAISALFVAQFLDTQLLDYCTHWSPVSGLCSVSHMPREALNNNNIAFMFNGVLAP